ncbi:Long-chain-fatty-acid--AMP ligase FadD26 [Pseudobythopirellula maris]|uniref:Long-chain-fatty-acid--AMP ligase FadD26 n=1 Tax=Pseudobythopirellula maris TaxID=2527991 RepID=A0A5C5ZJ67_9BACT|nr:aminotransferase class I/II-fold pyridoxal phosphate-dependent enzyme [Pseudobythopirellula maris]TWT87432.1 Long-chain-fatty-acid--AMP ligase FadD26 [Pseudobythopirellula maris]
MSHHPTETTPLSPPPQADAAADDLVRLLRDRAARLGAQRAFTFLVDGESERLHITYAELDARARAIAARLQSLGLSGERALLLYPSGLEFIAAFFGCLYAGVTAVPAFPPRRNRKLDRIRAIFADAKPRIALTTKEVYLLVEPMIQDFDDLSDMPWCCTGDLDASEGDDWAPESIDPQRLAFLQYTSGSTGTPKGVMLSHANLLHNTAVITSGFRPAAGSSGVTWLPLHHDMGLIGGVVQPIYAGRPMTVMSPSHFLQKPLRWLRALSDTGAPISGGPNFAYDLCVERVTEEEKRSLDLRQWELAFNGAEPVRADTLDRFARAFERCGFRREAFYPCYGLAEATLLVAGGDKSSAPTSRVFDAAELAEGQAAPAESGAHGATTLVASGAPLLDVGVTIVDPDTHEELAEGLVGEIWVSGPSVARGYWGREDATRETFSAYTAGPDGKQGRGPHLRTGDLGCFAHGELYVTGRLKDLIIVRGVNHYPQDIEQTVERAHPDLRAASGAAFAVGGAGEERLVIVHETVRRRDIDHDELIDAVRRQVAELHELTPHAVVLLGPHTIPKTSSGKIQRHACRAAYLAGELQVVASWDTDGGRQSAGRRRRGADDSSRGTLVLEATPTNDATDAAQPDLVERVLTVVRGVARERARDLALDDDLAGLGLDSLERMEIVAALEDEFGARFAEETVLGMATCRDIVTEVRRAVEGAAEGAPAKRLTRGDYVFAESPEYRRLRETIDAAAQAGVDNPYFTPHEGVTADTTIIDGREYVNFCSYNYLGMSGDPRVQAAAKRAIDRYGTSVSASRLVSGEKPLHRELERALAELIGADDAVAFVGGHATNETAIGCLVGPGDLVLHDSLAHNSLVQGARLSGARRRAFPHNDHAACERLLERYRGEHRRVLIAIEGVYSMDGDRSDVAAFIDIKRRHHAYLMVDEAHSLGTVGAAGRGMSGLDGVEPSGVDLWMGTLSKALGSCGGYIAAPKEIVEYLKYTAPGFVFSVGMPPAAAAAALASLELLREEPERVERLAENSRLLLRLCRQAGFDTGASDATPIVPVITGDSLAAMRLSRGMFERGVNVQPIVHPAVEESAARLRFFVTSTHSEEQIRLAVEALADARRELQKTVGKRGIAAPLRDEPGGDASAVA